MVPYSEIDRENPLTESTMPTKQHSKKKSHGAPSRRSHQVKKLHSITMEVDSEYQIAIEEMTLEFQFQNPCLGHHKVSLHF